MLQASYALHLFSSNSRSVLERENGQASTFPPKSHKTRLFLCFSTAHNDRYERKEAIRSGKNVLFLQNCYYFWEGDGNLFHLFRVPHLMRGNHLEPFIRV